MKDIFKNIIVMTLFIFLVIILIIMEILADKEDDC